MAGRKQRMEAWAEGSDGRARPVTAPTEAPLAVFSQVVRERDGARCMVRIGEARRTPDGGMLVALDAIPTSGLLVIRRPLDAGPVQAIATRRKRARPRGVR